MDNSQSHCASAGIRSAIAAILFVGGLLAVPTAQATPFSTDLSISGSVMFDSGYAAMQSTGASGQSGLVAVTQGTTPSSSTFSGSLVSGSNPLLGTLTDIDDGFGFSGTASASTTGTFGIGIDIGLKLANNSATNAYKIIFNVEFDNRVDSAGVDAYANSNFGIFDRVNNQTLFFTDLFSDTVNGNSNGGQPVPGVRGGSLAENGPASFVITLAAGQSLVFDPLLHDISWTLDGRAGRSANGVDSSSSASLDLFFSIASVESLTQPPTPTPEPATLALFGLGLAGLGAMRRRRAS